MDNRERISVVVPCYNERQALPCFYEAVRKIAEEREDLSFEFIFVNDGSDDGTEQYMKELAREDSRVCYVSLSRNFGKEAAMLAGLKYASGDYVAVMDADMQDPPELLPQMYDILGQGEYDCVASRRADRKGEAVIRSFFARMFYRIMGRISDTDIVDGARDFRLMTRRMTDSILELGEYNRFTKGIFGWVGFETKWISYENRERVAGETKWSFFKLFSYSVEGIVNFSTVPLRIASFVGMILCIASFISVVLIVVRKLIFGDPVAGWASLICVMLFTGGIELCCMGILGKYLACTYLETKKRPVYIVKESNYRNDSEGLRSYRTDVKSDDSDRTSKGMRKNEDVAEDEKAD